MSAGQGMPGELHPARVARDLRLDVPAGPVFWWESYGPNLLDAAVRAYWQNRPPQSKPALEEYRRRQKRRRTPTAVWLRRGAA